MRYLAKYSSYSLKTVFAQNAQKLDLKPNTASWAVFPLLTGKYQNCPKVEKGQERPDDGEGPKLGPDDEMAIKGKMR